MATVDPLIQRLVDESDIRKLVDIYARTMLDCDHATLASLFVPGGQLVIVAERRMEFAAPDGLRTVIDQMAAYDRVFYFVGNHTAEITGDLAKGETYTIGYHYLGTADGAAERVIEVPVRYVDTFMRTAEGWRFRERIATILWTHRHHVDPEVRRPS